MNNLYEVLGVGRDASSDDIRAAYRALARDIHPDGIDAPADAHVQMAQVNEAWSILGDAGRRSAYDALTFESTATSEVMEPPDLVVPASAMEAVVPLASATGAILTGLGFAGGAPGLMFFGALLIGVAIVAFVVRRKRL